MAKLRIVCYFRRDGIEFYPDHLAEPVYLKFQPEVVKNLEVLNDEVLESQFLAVIEELKVKKADFLFLIADDALFTKEIALDTAEKMDAELQAFLDLVPIATDMRVVGKRASDKTVTHFALNKALYMRIVRALQRLKYSVLVVVPTFVLPIELNLVAFGSAPSLDFASIDKIASTAIQAKSENLLLQEPKPVVADKSVAGVSFSMKVDDKKKLFLSIFFVALCIIVFAAVLYTTLKPIFVRPKPVVPTATPVESVVPVATEQPLEQLPVELTSPTPTNEVRKSLNISIVNASGVAGQAKQIQAQLEPLGYQKFTASNGTAAAGQTTTEIQFGPNVPPEIKTEIETAVKSLFASAQVTTASAEIRFDVVITTFQ